MLYAGIPLGDGGMGASSADRPRHGLIEAMWEVVRATPRIFWLAALPVAAFCYAMFKVLAFGANTPVVTIADARPDVELLRELSGWRRAREPISRKAHETWELLPDYIGSRLIDGAPGTYFFSGEATDDITASTDLQNGNEDFNSARVMFGPENAAFIVQHANAVIPFDGNFKLHQGGEALSEGEFRFLAKAPDRTAILWGRINSEGPIAELYVQSFSDSTVYGPFDISDFELDPCSLDDDLRICVGNDEALFAFALSRGGNFFGVINRNTGALRAYETASPGAPPRYSVKFADIRALEGRYEPDVPTADTFAISSDGEIAAFGLKANLTDSYSFNPGGLIILELDDVENLTHIDERLQDSTGFQRPFSDIQFSPGDNSIIFTQSLTLNGRAVNEVFELNRDTNIPQLVHSGGAKIEAMQVLNNYVAVRAGGFWRMWERRTGSSAPLEEVVNISLPDHAIDVVANDALQRIHVVSARSHSMENLAPLRVGEWPIQYKIDDFTIRSHRTGATPSLAAIRAFQSDRGQHFDLSADGRYLVSMATVKGDLHGGTEPGRSDRPRPAVIFSDRKTGEVRAVAMPSRLRGFSRRSLQGVNLDPWIGIFFHGEGAQKAVAVTVDGNRLVVANPFIAEGKTEAATALELPEALTDLNDLRHTSDRQYVMGNIAYFDELGQAQFRIAVWNAGTGALLMQSPQDENGFFDLRSSYDFDPVTQSIAIWPTPEILEIHRKFEDGSFLSVKSRMSEQYFIEGLSVIPGTGKVMLIASHREQGARVVFKVATFDLTVTPDMDLDLSTLQFNEIDQSGQFNARYSVYQLPQILDFAWSKDNSFVSVAINDLAIKREAVGIYAVREDGAALSGDETQPAANGLQLTRLAGELLINAGWSVTRHLQFNPVNPAEVIISANPVTKLNSFVWDTNFIREDTCDKLRYYRIDRQSVSYVSSDAYFDACSPRWRRVFDQFSKNLQGIWNWSSARVRMICKNCQLPWQEEETA